MSAPTGGTVILTAPVAGPTTTTLTLREFNCFVMDLAIHIAWTDNAGNQYLARYTTPPPPGHPTQPTGQTLLGALNVANFSAGNTLLHAIFSQLQADGYVAAGIIT